MAVAAVFLVVAITMGIEGMSKSTGAERLSAKSLRRLMSPDRYRQAVTTLSSEAMEGRMIGTPGGQAAVRFIEAEFRQAGLLPGYRGGYRQDYKHVYDGIADATNVIAYLPGVDAAVGKEVIVVSAHHDHLGRSLEDGCPNDKMGDQIKPGANDNASGTAALIELAYVFAPFKDQLRRTLVFLATDGEECGCTGIKQYVYRDPAFPLADTIYNLNIDQIGEGADLETQRLNLGRSEDENCDVDAEVFANRGIRAQSLVGGNSHYHEPTDTVENMDFDAAMRVVRRASRLLLKEIQAP